MIQSIERGIEILRLLEAGPLGVTELANATALPKTTVHRLLKTFEAHHWVEFNGAKKYQLSWGVLPMAKSFLTSLDVRAIAQPYMVAIRDQLQQSVNLFLAQGDYRILYRARCGGQAFCVTTSRSARCTLFFKGAAGKIFGAYLGDFKDADIEC